MRFYRQTQISETSGSGSLGVQPRMIALFAVVVFSLLVRDGNANNGNDEKFPVSVAGRPTFSIQSGLQIQLDSTWTGNRGYRPVTITVTTAKPATADTLITIVFDAGSWRSGQRAISVESDLELTQGSTSTSSTFFVPQYIDWNALSWETWVDGVKDEQLCQLGVGFNSGSTGTVAAGIFMTGLQNTNTTQLIQSATGSAVDVLNFDLATLPHSWIDYSSLDVFAISVRSLELIRVSSPEKLTELLRWVRAGGNLWVLGGGEDFSELPALEELLNASRDNDAAQRSPTTLPLSDWRFLKFDTTSPTRVNDLVKLTMDLSSDDEELSSREILDSKNPNRAVDSRQWFVARAYGLGTIVALQEVGRTPGWEVGEAMIALQKTSIPENLQWTTRHGNDPATGNPNFNNLLIPDVGTAPVFEFQLLISLFVIGIGPVNYWLLKRRNQLLLLLVTVPAAALAATLMLFAYGLLADGIGVRVRARSMTMLDQQAGEAASWAWQSYYAGIAPSDGLIMPTDTTVYPILPSRSEYSSFGRRHIYQQRALEWDQQQRLTRGWLGSRTPTQYLTVTARPTKKHLQFKTQADQMTVTNHLGTQILALVVQDQAGNIFVGDQVEVDGSEKLSPTSYVKAASKLRIWITDNLPQLPAGYVESSNSYRRNYGVPISDSLMELQFEAMASPIATGWGNGTYIAVTSTGVEVPLGVEDVTESNSFHVVRGTW